MEPISRAERQLLALVVEGLTDREIAERLHYSRHTIDHYLQRLREKAEARNRVQLAAWAVRHGYDALSPAQ